MTRTHKVCGTLLLLLCSVSAGCISVLEAAGFSFLSDGLWRQVSCKAGLHLEFRKECVSRADRDSHFAYEEPEAQRGKRLLICYFPPLLALFGRYGAHIY